MGTKDIRVGLIGLGHMGQILARSFLDTRLLSSSQLLFTQRDPKKEIAHQKAFGITAARLPTLVEKSDLLLLAVRPAQAKEVLEQLKNLPSKPILSILAGTTIAFFQKFLGATVPVIRAMPNLASAVGEGMTVLSYSSSVSTDLKSLCRQLFQCSGKIAEVQEKQMDLVCGLTGSSPGFVFRLIDAAARLGEKEGLSYQEALQMSAQAFLGAAKLAQQGTSLEKLSLEIAVPGGTTEAGLHLMQQMELGAQFQKVIAASIKRSKELSETA